MFEHSPNTLKILEFYKSKYAPSIAVMGLLKALSVASLKLKNLRPLSVITVAPSGQFKTRMSVELENIFGNRMLTYLGSDFTAHSLWRSSKEKPINNTCCVINDLVFLFTSKSERGRQRLTSAFAELLSEGRYDYGDYKEGFCLKAHISLVTNVTIDYFMKYNQELIQNTFGERCLIAFYRVRDEDGDAFNKDRHNRVKMLFGEKVKLKGIAVDYGDKREIMSEYARRWRLLMLSPSIERSFDKVVSVASSNAVLNGRCEVNDDDIAVLDLVEPYLVNYASPRVKIVLLASEVLPNGGKRSNYQICLDMGKDPAFWKGYVAKVKREYQLKGVIPLDDEAVTPPFEEDGGRKWGGLHEREFEPEDSE